MQPYRAGRGDVTRAARRALAALVAGLLLVTGAGGAVLAQPATQAQGADQAAVAQQVHILAGRMDLPGIFGVMQAEGVTYGEQLRDELLAGKGGAQWGVIVKRIYDPARMLDEVEARLTRELAARPDSLAEASAFFASPVGQKIVGLEVEARRALLDDAAETAAQQAFAGMEESGAPRLEALRRFAATNDLIEMNVMGALNASFAFYQGMSQGGAFGPGMSEQDMLTEVWSQEDAVRTDAEAWLWPYLALAYQPLSDEEFQAYQRFSETAGGRDLNAALFAAFDGSFVRISRELGLAAAQMIEGEDI